MEYSEFFFYVNISARQRNHKLLQRLVHDVPEDILLQYYSMMSVELGKDNGYRCIAGMLKIMERHEFFEECVKLRDFAKKYEIKTTEDLWQSLKKNTRSSEN